MYLKFLVKLEYKNHNTLKIQYTRKNAWGSGRVGVLV